MDMDGNFKDPAGEIWQDSLGNHVIAKEDYSETDAGILFKMILNGPTADKK